MLASQSHFLLVLPMNLRASSIISCIVTTTSEEG